MSWPATAPVAQPDTWPDVKSCSGQRQSVDPQSVAAVYGIVQTEGFCFFLFPLVFCLQFFEYVCALRMTRSHPIESIHSSHYSDHKVKLIRSCTAPVVMARRHDYGQRNYVAAAQQLADMQAAGAIRSGDHHKF